MKLLPSRRVRAGVMALAAATVISGLSACDPTPDQDPFYTPPSPLPVVANGDIIRSRESVFTLDPVNRTPVPGVSSHQVLYRSTDANGQAIAVSGTVLVPTTPYLGNRPLVSYAVGTRGLGDHCAPSYTLSQGIDYEGLFIQAMLARGWAVAVSDYEGLGTPAGHPYMVGQSAGRSVIDMARAAQRLPGTGLRANTPVGFFGYSQGGGAAAWAAQLAGSYGSGLNVKGTAAGGVPADLIPVAEHLDGSAFTALMLMASIGYDNAYPELDLEAFVNDRGADLLAESSEVCLVSVDGVTTLFSTLFTSRSDFTHTDPLADPAWLDRLEENRLGSIRPSAPIYLYHGIVDEMVEYGQGAQFRRDLCNRGATVTWEPVIGEHVSTMVTHSTSAANYLAARFAGLPTFGTCWLP